MRSGGLRIALLALFLLPALDARGAGSPREPLTVMTEARVLAGVTLRDGWRYHPGDDPAFADPALDDRPWPLVSSTMPDPSALPGGWIGVGWFRRALVLAPEVEAVVMGLFTTQTGASEVYLDGRRVATFGTVGSTPEEEKVFFPRRFTAVELRPGPAHVLAVRFSNASGGTLDRRMRGFIVQLLPVEQMSRRAVTLVLSGSVAPAVLGGVFAGFAVLYLLLFLFRPRSLENLYFALFTGSLAANSFAEIRLSFAEEATEVFVALALVAVTAVGMIVSGLALEHAVFRRRWSPLTWVVGGAGVAMLAWTFTWTAFQPLVVPHLYVLLGSAEMLRIAVVAVRRREPDAWIVAAGLGALTGAVLFSQTVQIFGIATALHGPLFVVAAVVLVFAFGAYLSRRVARTQRELEARLAEVQELTARTVEQERRAVAEEAEKRLLAAENARKSAELEEARRMQLAMLPAAAPPGSRHDLAFRMATATEVGGDYVDLCPRADGSLLVALGDATSHGLQAGMVVAVAKSLFQTSREEPGPAAVLRRVGEGLAALRERRASMSLTVMRLDGSSLQVASAGMPPLLVHRHESGTVEEVLLPGMPLGVRPETAREERVILLGSGDAVLAMTDGLVESVNAAGEQFGYERASALFAGLATRDADGIVDGMLADAVSFLGGVPLQDDFSVLALRVDGKEPRAGPRSG